MKSSKFQGVVAWSGGQTVLRVGDRYSDDHPMVQDRPELFDDGDNETDVKRRAPEPPPRPEGVVESTMQVPGANRTSRVPKSGSGQ